MRRVLAFLERHLPDAVGPELYTRACCYDFPPDRDFIVDYVPGSQRILVCAGAGHAGKFAGHRSAARARRWAGLIRCD